jgi:hypothetical protein
MRFLSVDPLAHLREWVSPYNYVQNNPIMRIDPDGRLDGDYYDSKTGAYLGTDGVNDGLEHRIEKSFFDDQKSALTAQNAPAKEIKRALLTGVDETSYNHKFSRIADYNTANNKVMTATESSSNVMKSYALVNGAKASTSKAVSGTVKGVGLGLTLIESAQIVDYTVTTGDYQGGLKKTGQMVFESAVVDRALTSPNPYFKAAAVMYYVSKAAINGSGNSTPPSGVPANWNAIKDQDNTRVNSGTGF